MTEAQSVDLPTFIEHRVPHGGGSLYVRDFAGEGPAFVLLHGFPDNLHIYDDLVPHLVAAGRRTVAFDFLGFGASDKPKGAACRALNNRSATWKPWLQRWALRRSCPSATTRAARLRSTSRSEIRIGRPGSA